MAHPTLVETVGNHGGDTVVAHCHPVECSCDFHGVFVMGDEQELRAFEQLFVDGQQASEVHLIERCFDLVENVERTGSGDKQADQKPDRNQRPPTPAKKREPAQLLASRTRHCAPLNPSSTTLVPRMR